jgi:hypothetical protein
MHRALRSQPTFNVQLLTLVLDLVTYETYVTNAMFQAVFVSDQSTVESTESTESTKSATNSAISTSRVARLSVSE